MIQETFTSNGDADNLITRNKDEQLLDMAWEWLCRARKNAPPSADIWDLRLHWPEQRGRLITQLKAGRYRLSAMWVVGKKKQAMWTARDALVLKWVALKLAGRLPLHPRCEHVKGHGGGAASLRRLSEVVRSGDYPWVCRTDIKGYYGAIQKPFLLEQLRQQRLAPEVLHLLEQYLHYSVESGGEFHTPERGIPRGCALSPLMGAFHLWAVDNHFSRQPGIYYARYMDDFVILTKTRWQLRRQVASLNRFFNDYGFRQHPDKTFIGRTAKGFDWMGAQLGASGVTGVAPRALANHWAKVRRLYEQTWLSRTTRSAKVSSYRARWIIWCVGVCTTFPLHAIDVRHGLTRDVATTDLSHSGLNRAYGTANAGGFPYAFGGQLAVGRRGSVFNINDLICGYGGGSRLPIASIDGYTGFLIAPQVLAVPEGSLSSAITIRWPDYKGAFRQFTWSSSAAATGAGSGWTEGYTNCIPASPTPYLAAPLSSSINANIRWHIYVGARVPPGLIAGLFEAGVVLSTYPNDVPDNYVSRIVPLPPLNVIAVSCGITLDPRINFGTVAPGALSISPTSVRVTCDHRVAPSLRITAANRSADGNSVNLRTGTGEVVGLVRGYRPGVVSGKSCGAASGALPVDGSPIPLGQVVAGEPLTFPIEWLLCSLPNATGSATGSAALEVDW